MLSDLEKEMLRHASGADSDSPGYRNRYCTTVDDPTALSLVSLGLMQGPKYTQGDFGEGYGLFFITEKGFDYLGFKEKK